MNTDCLTPDLASRFARLALGHVTREFPNKLDHVMSGPEDARTPRDLHPIFYGSFDWHSCVHGYWLLARLHRLFRGLPEGEAIAQLFDIHLTAERVEGERRYLERPLSTGFERPYGWAWLLMLDAELSCQASADGRRWRAALKPLGEAFARRFTAFLPKATYPIRSGAHFNTAFALALVQEYAAVCANDALEDLVGEKARAWYGRDAGCQPWEPSGDDFLSPALIEAECMRRVLPEPEFRDWFQRFLPAAAERQPATLFEPAVVSDRSDGKIAHLDGLNLSRAWCWRSIAAGLSDEDPVRTVAEEAARVHLAAGLPHVAGDYMGEHWLATFALLALQAPA